MFKKLTLLIALAIGLCWCFTQEVQAQNVPDEYIYFDLAAGNVNISKTTYQGYVYVNGVKTTVSGTHIGSRKYYVYQSSSVTGSYDKDHTGYANNDDFSNKRNVRIPDYTAITGGGNTWEEFCTNNTDVRTVSTTWNASSTMAGRTCCENRILINLEGGTESDLCDITIDNLWSEYSNFDETDLSESEFRARGEGGIYNYNGGYTVLRMKNHSKFHSICFPKKSSVPGYFKFTSFTGDGSTSGSITLTLLKGDDFSEEECLNSTSLIGGWYYENKRTPTSDLIFNGGTIYAGVENHVAKGPHISPTAIGGGACETGEVTINGGNVTAVTSSTAAAIGGGGGIGGVGKDGTVTITGGKVYAYNYGLYVDFYSADMDETLTAGASGTAIGGGSTVGWATSTACLGGEGNVTITGGEVFALSVGGNAIGGGNSYRIGGGTGTINISGGNIIAKSVAGDIGSTHWTPSTAIGGGTGGVREGSGGDAIVNISGNPVILTGSIGGGKTSNATGKIGTAQVRISGNPDVSGQFILAAGSEVDPYFEMKGGIIHNSSTFDEVYYKVKEDGGAVYLENGKVSIQGGTIDNCKAKSGGAVYMTAGEFEMTGGTIKGGEATVNGGAVCMAAGEFTLSGGEIGVNGKPNKAQKGGGVYVTSGNVYVNGTGKLSYNSAINIGGGAYIDGGNIQMTNGEIVGNTAVNGGGGFYVPGGTVTITGGDVKNNIVTVGNGGGFYSVGGTVSISNATISGNHADNGYGGGLYSAAAITVGTEAMGTGATVSGNEAKNGGGFYVAGEEESETIIQGGSIISGNIASVNGAGAYIASGNLKVNSSDIMGNHADNGNGGGFFVNGGALTLSGGNIGEDGAPNHAINGGGFYINGGTVELNAGLVQYNTATTAGGGFYMQGGQATISNGTVQNNAATNGAGLYMQGTDGSLATATFSSGSFTGNTASNSGGGIYLADYSELNMSGSSAITGNSAGVKGGGVFKTAGNEHSKLQVSGTSLQVVNNTVGSQRNNVYLDSYSDYITVDPAAGISDQVKVGISVNVNSTADLPTPVIHCDDVSKLNNIFNMLKENTGNGIFDDAAKYVAVYQSHPAPFNSKEIFFIATWVANVEDITDFDNTQISTPNELAYFMVLVNGLNGHEAQPNLSGTVIADIDMTEYYWTPIGEWDHNDPDYSTNPPIYKGNFEGGGHTITGLNTCGVIGYYNYGLFGRTEGAVIRNLVLADCDFTSGETMRMGNLIAEMDGGTVSNCIVSGTLNPAGSETQESDEHYCVVGGLVGETKNSATIRNCIATAKIQAEPIDDELYFGMQAFTVGGLVGMASAGTVIENSFANPEIHHGGRQGEETALSNPNRYVGGLIGENCGTVRNCYVRLQRDNQLTATVSKFGMFAGKNSGTIEYCYYPEESLRSIMVGSTSTPNQPLVNAGPNPTNYGEYNTTVTPYYYKHNDNLVTEINGAAVETPVSLLAKLNEWVETNGTTYSHWMRTCASPINDDYPVLQYDNVGYSTIASRDGINMEYNKSLNTMIGKYNTNGSALFVYNTPAEEINKSTAIPLYVGEDAALQLKPGTAITNAYVGITLDNSKSKTVGNETGNQFNWHMFSTPLAAAPLGVNYQDNHTSYNYWNSQDIPDFGFYPEGNALHGYFPSKTFGTDGTDGVPYYAEWDYYTYLEPHYHWINFKRNSESHYHQDTDNPQYPNHSQIVYANETELVKGKGYLLATKEETYLQCNGTLNSGEVSIALDYTEDNHPVYRGCNLLGNPYQSYLNFDETGLGSYAILDEDLGGYVAYTKGASRNAYPTLSKEGGEITAPGKYIHMHQGFFVVASASGQGVTFTPSMCTNLADGSFRGEEQPAYPLVNLAVTEADGSREFVTIELDRPDNGGAVKMKGLRNGSSLIYTHVDGEDYSIAFMPVGTTAAAVRFETLDEGTFTMNWNTQNGAFSYLHLIDNKTGMDIDCLASGEYRFKASPEDYASRFKLVFSYTGVEEAEAEAEDFAFLMNGILVINGEGTADIFDLTGRLVSSTRLTGSQNTLSLPALTQGLYMIRLSNGNGSKVQKIVIK